MSECSMYDTRVIKIRGWYISECPLNDTINMRGGIHLNAVYILLKWEKWEMVCLNALYIWYY
jgi:hypothetical protein